MHRNDVVALDDDIPDAPVTLVSADDVHFSVSRETLRYSTYLTGVLDVDTDVTTIPLDRVDSKTLMKIIEWLEYHQYHPPKEIPRPLETPNLKITVGYWDADFIDVDLDTVYTLLLTANFLGIVPLLELCCAKIASLIMGRTPEKIRETFTLPESFSDEDEARFRREFAAYLNP